MRFWCGDFETDDWVVGVPVENFAYWVAVAIVVSLLGYWYYSYQEAERLRLDAEKKKKEAEEKKKKTDEEEKKKKEEDEKKKKAEDALKNEKSNIAETNWKEALETLDGKLRELQDGHRSVMISDNYNRIMWIAEGVRQARDALENTMLKKGFKKP